MNDRKQAFDNLCGQMLNNTIRGINEVVAIKQREINYWKNKAQLTNEQLLKMLGERIATGEIKRELSSFGNYLMIETERGILKVDLHDGQLTPDRKEVNNA